MRKPMPERFVSCAAEKAVKREWLLARKRGLCKRKTVRDSDQPLQDRGIRCRTAFFVFFAPDQWIAGLCYKKMTDQSSPRFTAAACSS